MNFLIFFLHKLDNKIILQTIRKMIKEINFSKQAVERINQLVSNKPKGTFFRIAVKGGGCSGFKYDFSFD